MKRRWLSSIVVIGGVLTPVLVGASYDAKDLRDPFYPLLSPEGGRREPKKLESSQEGQAFGGVLKLEGILYDAGGHSMAVINGEVFQTGDVREGIEVTQIEADRVVVLKSGAEIELRLPVPEADEEKS